MLQFRLSAFQSLLLLTGHCENRFWCKPLTKAFCAKLQRGPDIDWKTFLKDLPPPPCCMGGPCCPSASAAVDCCAAAAYLSSSRLFFKAGHAEAEAKCELRLLRLHFKVKLHAHGHPLSFPVSASEFLHQVIQDLLYI